MCFAEEENYHDWKAVAVTCAVKDMLLATYKTYLVTMVYSLCFHFIKQEGEINGEIALLLPKLEVFPNFRDGQ